MAEKCNTGRADQVACLLLMTGLSQEEFGALFDVERMTVWRWLEGRAPSPGHEAAIGALWRGVLALPEGALLAIGLEVLEKKPKGRIEYWRAFLEDAETGRSGDAERESVA